MTDPRAARRRARVVAAAALANLAVSLLLALFLAPGTLAGGAGRQAFVAAHAGTWRAGWLAWMVGTAGLVVFFAAVHAALGRPPAGRAALVLLIPGVAADLGHDYLQTTSVVAAARGDAAAFLALEARVVMLGGGVVNLFYGLAGLALTAALRSAGAPRWLVVQSAALWTTTLLLAAAGFARHAPALVATTALTMAQFVAFAAVVAWRLHRRGRLAP